MVKYKKFLFSSLFIFVVLIVGQLFAPKNVLAAPVSMPQLSIDDRVLNDTGPSNTDGYTSRLLLAFDASCDSSANQVLFYRDGSVFGSPSQCVDINGLYVATSTPYYFAESPHLIEGVQLSGGLFSATSTFNIVIDRTRPGNEDSVFMYNSDIYKKGGVPVSIASSTSSGGTSTDEVWFAPNGTGVFNPGSTMTMTDGASSTLNTPTHSGTYKLYVVDLAGNVSGVSTHNLIVDNTPPSNQDSVFGTSTTVRAGGTNITIDPTTSSSTDTFWFAPSGTATSDASIFIATSTMTSASGTSTSIISPASLGTYSLFVIDAAGNVSNPSTATLTVAVPINQNNVFNLTIPGNKLWAPFGIIYAHPGESVVIDPTTSTSTDTFWIAPQDTTIFATSSTTTSASATSTSITVPTVTGLYRFFVIDSLGNRSDNSTVSLHVDDGTSTSPIASPDSGTYTGTQNVVISATNTYSLAKINYTTDGSSPDCTAGTFAYYSGYGTSTSISVSVPVSFSETINAIACDINGGSATSTFTYTINYVSSDGGSTGGHGGGHPTGGGGGGGGGGGSFSGGSNPAPVPDVTSSSTTDVTAPTDSTSTNQNSSPDNSANSNSSLTDVVSTDLSDVALAEQSIMRVKINLKLGATNNAVKLLQWFLATQDMGPKAKELSAILNKYGATKYFRKITEDALTEWQTAVNMVVANGKFGPVTRAKIVELYGSQ